MFGVSVRNAQPGLMRVTVTRNCEDSHKQQSQFHQSTTHEWTQISPYERHYDVLQFVSGKLLIETTIEESTLNKNIEKDLGNEFLLGDLCEVVTKGTTPTTDLLQNHQNKARAVCCTETTNGTSQHYTNEQAGNGISRRRAQGKKQL